MENTAIITSDLDLYDPPLYAGYMSNVEKIRREIQQAVAAGRVTKSELARQADIPVTTLIGMDKPSWNPHWGTLAALEVALIELIPERKSRPKKRADCRPAFA